MTARYKIGLVMSACVALGALGSEALHGEARPPAYLIGQITSAIPLGTPKNTSRKPERSSRRTVGVCCSCRRGCDRLQVVAIDGEAPKRVVIYMYPSMEALQAWRNDPAYVQVRGIGEKYAKYHTFAVEGAAGTSP